MFTTITTLKNGTELVRLDDGRLAVLLTAEPNHTTKAGNPAYDTGYMQTAIVDGTEYTVNAMVITRTLAQKAAQKLASAEAKALAKLAEIAAARRALAATQPQA